jgi:AraC-type DNA-binding domain-containing proteins
MSFVYRIERFKPLVIVSDDGHIYKTRSHDGDELTLILEGEGYYSSSEQNIQVGAGNLILIPAGLRHGFVCTKPWRGISVHFYKDELPAFCQYLFQSKSSTSWLHIAKLNEQDMHWVDICLSNMEREWKAADQNIDSNFFMRNVFETVLLLFERNQRECSPQMQIQEKNETVIQDVLKEIHARYFDKITVHELAARHFLSESSLRKKFLGTIGISPKQYMINLRVREAKRLLKQTDKAIEAISNEVGFSSCGRFYDFFVKTVGVTPLEWRKQYKVNVDSGAKDIRKM